MSTTLPRFFRMAEAPTYLGMNKNLFNQIVRPHVREIRIGKQGIAFDRDDLDAWAADYKARQQGAKSFRRPLCQDRERQGLRRAVPF